MKWIVMALLLMAAVGCGESQCHTGDTRCSHEVVEVCAAGQWAEVADCRDVSAEQNAPWACCAVSVSDSESALHACLPRAECTGGDE
jgi:hypothetical protein